MRPERANIAAPVLPPRLRWLNAERAPVLAELTAAGPVLVHFFDFAQLNSVRALPYAIAWDRRYRDAGADAVLIGEALVTGGDPETTLETFHLA